MKHGARPLSEKLQAKTKVDPKRKRSNSLDLLSLKISSPEPISFEEFNTSASTIKRLIKQHLNFDITEPFYQFMISMNYSQFEFLKHELSSYQCYLIVLFNRFLNAKWPKSSRNPHFITQQQLLKAYMGAVIVSSKLVSDRAVWNVDICEEINKIYIKKIRLIQSHLASHEPLLAKVCHLDGAILHKIIVCLTIFPLQSIDLKKVFELGSALPPESFEEFQQAFEILELFKASRLLDLSSFRDIEIEFVKGLDWNICLFATEVQADLLLTLSRNYDRSFSTLFLFLEQERKQFELKIQNFGQINKDLASPQVDTNDNKSAANPVLPLFSNFERLEVPSAPSSNTAQNEEASKMYRYSQNR